MQRTQVKYKTTQSSPAKTKDKLDERAQMKKRFIQSIAKQ